MKRVRVVDLETTGLTDEAEILELGMMDLQEDRDGKWSMGPENAWLFRPLGAIPPQARAVHHIGPRQVAGKPTWAEAGRAVWSLSPIESFDMLAVEPRPKPLTALLAHQADYEKPKLEHLEPGVPWLCTYKCALRQWPDAPSHGNFSLLYWLEDQGLIPEAGPAMDARLWESHRAAPDCVATALLFRCLARLQPWEVLLQWSQEERWIARVPFGEHKGKRWEEIDLGLLEWTLRKDFDTATKDAARREIDRRMAARDRDDAAGDLFRRDNNAR